MPALRYFLLPVVVASLPLFAEVKVTYLANEGVMLTSGSTKVLVDSLFRDSLGSYPRHSADQQERIETGKPPFDGVVLALATHFHLDHWDAGAATRFLTHNPNAIFASTAHGVAMMPSGQKRRARSLWPADGAASATLDAGSGVRVDAVPLVHGQVQNLAYRISMGGRTLMHLGDAGNESANYETLQKQGPPPDVLLVPFWWLIEDKAVQFLTQTWKPKNIVAIHFGANDAATSAGKIRADHPGVWVCTTAGESKTY
jgi:L-ascorbate metabolism protein UlaG (beta-lactamase superfamily)